ncbi:MAG: tetratricopeptide repeat protein [Acidobacteriia bacterium]|nr:tetratricopeptide repeat protein [Terriglobia bacterium]
MNPEALESNGPTRPFAASHSGSDRDAVLFLSLLGLVILFTLAGVVVRLFHAKEKALGAEWYARGEADLNAGKPSAAIVDFRNALAYGRDNPTYRLHLALALTAAGRIEEARAHLLSLWEQQPGDGTINLELARLAAREGNTSDAVRYFQNAIFGVWPGNPDEQRRAVRFELCQFLLARGLRSEAQAALIDLAAKLPKEAGLHVRVGNLFLEAADSSRALAEFREALARSSRDEGGLAGAGRAAYQMGDYQTAHRYLERLAKLYPQNSSAGPLLETTNLVLSIDPQARGLSARERAARALRAFEQATTRLETCIETRNEILGSTDAELQAALGHVDELRPKVRPATLARDSDLLMQTMDLAFEVEELCEHKCGPATGLDLALLLLARQHGGAEP